MESTANRPSRSIEDELSEHGNYATNTVGVSMKPLFKTHRDVVTLIPPDREIKKYDILLYKTPDGRYVLHRVIAVKDGIYVIRGDNTYVKEYVPREWVIAYAVAFNRKGKRHKTTDLSYKIYSRLWHFIYPVRLVFFKMRMLLSKIKRKIKG